MVTFLRNYEVKTGKLPEALALAQEAMGHIKKTYDIDVDIYMPVGGNPLRIGLVAEYENMGEVEAQLGRLAADASWPKIMSKAADLIVEGSVTDEFWKKV